MKKIIKSRIFYFILGGLIFSSIGVVAATISAKDISFTPTNENWNVNNIDEALNELFINVDSTIETLNNEISLLQVSLDDLRENSQYVSGTIEKTSDCATSNGCGTDVYFNPSLFYIIAKASTTNIFYYDKNFDVNNFYGFYSTANKASLALMTSYFKFENENWILYNFSSSYVNGTLEYVACK